MLIEVGNISYSGDILKKAAITNAMRKAAVNGIFDFYLIEPS